MENAIGMAFNMLTLGADGIVGLKGMQEILDPLIGPENYVVERGVDTRRVIVRNHTLAERVFIRFGHYLKKPEPRPAHTKGWKTIRTQYAQGWKEEAHSFDDCCVMFAYILEKRY
jgi:hypothetical protein